jgi:hypothetical protein
MKNLFFSIATIAIFSLSSFTTVSNSSNLDESGTVPCKWRNVFTHADGTKSYTEWIHGNCNVSDSGVLYPIQN